MSKYAGTKTEKNLMEAFAGESQARNKYTYFASVARKEGYEQIAAIFEEAAANEKEHAKLWFKELVESEILLQILLMLQKVSMKSILLCIQEWLRKLKKKDSKKLQLCSQWLARLKRNTKRDI